jgi:hypothetical protein
MTLLHMHIRFPGETAPQHQLQERTGAGVGGDTRKGPGQRACARAQYGVSRGIERADAPRDQLVPPARHQLLEGGRTRRHQQMGAAALGYAPAHQWRGGNLIRMVAATLKNRDALEASSESMCGQQATDPPADDHSVSVGRHCCSRPWSDGEDRPSRKGTMPAWLLARGPSHVNSAYWLCLPMHCFGSIRSRVRVCTATKVMLPGFPAGSKEPRTCRSLRPVK